MGFGGRAGVGVDAVLVGLEWETEAINRRINERVREMVRRGLVEEARGLWEGARFGAQSREALGYKQLIAHFEGRGTLEDCAGRSTPLASADRASDSSRILRSGFRYVDDGLHGRGDP